MRASPSLDVGRGMEYEGRRAWLGAIAARGAKGIGDARKTC